MATRKAAAPWRRCRARRRRRWRAPVVALPRPYPDTCLAHIREPASTSIEGAGQRNEAESRHQARAPTSPGPARLSRGLPAASRSPSVAEPSAGQARLSDPSERSGRAVPTIDSAIQRFAPCESITVSDHASTIAKRALPPFWRVIGRKMVLRRCSELTFLLIGRREFVLTAATLWPGTGSVFGGLRRPSLGCHAPWAVVVRRPGHLVRSACCRQWDSQGLLRWRGWWRTR
jgi:hypothetical protein